jgi:hypothetical protein
MPRNSQQFRLFAALMIALAGFVLIGILAATGRPASDFVQAAVLLAIGFLFGTSTNGSGLGGK